MSAAVIPRYRVAPGRGPENAELVRAVYAELEATRPDGFRYATWVAEDGEEFVHVALSEQDAAPALTGLASFRRFQAGLAERCVESPRLTRLSEQVGGYRL